MSNYWEKCKDYSAYSGPQEPTFLRDRVEKFYSERVNGKWSGGHIMRGIHPNADAIKIDHNDYLSIANHPDIVKAQCDILNKEHNIVLMSGVFLHGEDNLHRQFEVKLADFLGREDVLLCQSGYAANVGLIQSIAYNNTPIYIDMMAHMSLWEGVKSAGQADPHFFRHNDPVHLEKLIKQYGEGIIIVDSLYSTNGSICPLKEVIAIGEKYNCILVVDESHSLATFGPEGRGMVYELGLTDKVHFITSSLAKGFAGRAGMISCSSRNREYLIFHALPAIFSSTLLVHEVAGLLATLEVVKQAETKRAALHSKATFLRQQLIALGYNLENSQSQIISLESGSEEQTIILRDALQAQGIFGAVFCAPAVPANRTLIRFCVNTDLPEADLLKIVQVCKDIRDEVDMWNWPSTKRLQRNNKIIKLANNEPRPLEQLAA